MGHCHTQVCDEWGVTFWLFMSFPLTLGCSIIDQITAAFPSDMPDLKEATNHLAPLDLPAQIGLYYPGREGRLGVQVGLSLTVEDILQHSSHLR